ncbi:MAG TPA: hypothetical protein VFG29_10060 [Syntrophales bacterium]|nr:hypothetical protein [Syntrophales bacterium]
MANQNLKPADRIEILTFQHNYIEMTAMDNDAVATRAISLPEDKPAWHLPATLEASWSCSASRQGLKPCAALLKPVR